jgi:CheY-like chemotaxis protein
VVNNLLTNALKYTPAGGSIAVRVSRDSEQAVLEVSDTGVGIHPALLPKIFDLFVQAERTLDRRAGGLGIGLTLVRRLVELHGGSVGAMSSSTGTVFTVRLPAVEAPLARIEHSQVPPSRRRRIGVIEDNEDALETLHTMLELDGHSVWCATDGISGLSSLLNNRPDVAVVDIGLPGLTGLEVAKRSRAAGFAGKMIAISGYGHDSYCEQAFAAGFDKYLVKPIDLEQLRRMLAED